jgi:hypothetical protein
MVNEAAGHQACVAFVTHRRPTALLLFPTSPESPIRHVCFIIDSVSYCLSLLIIHYARMTYRATGRFIY